MRTAYIHIGFNKTGSTSIQQALTSQHNNLLNRGILYPTGNNNTFFQLEQHAPLAASMPSSNIHWILPEKKYSIKQSFEDLNKYCSNIDHDILALSSEGFGAVETTTKDTEWLKKQLKEYRIKIIAYIRRQDHYLLALYQEMVKFNRTRVFHIGEYMTDPHLDFNARLTPWKATFGEENVIVRPFEKTQWHRGCLISDFFNIIKIPTPETPATIKSHSNESLDYRTVEFLRILNKKRNARGGNQILALSLDRMISHKYQKKKMQLDTETAFAIKKKFKKSNQDALRNTDCSEEDFFTIDNMDTPSRLTPTPFPHELLVEFISCMDKYTPIIRNEQNLRFNKPV